MVEGSEECPQAVDVVGEVEKALHPKCRQGLPKLHDWWQLEASLLSQLLPEAEVNQQAEVRASQPLHDMLEECLVSVVVGRIFQVPLPHLVCPGADVL